MAVWAALYLGDRALGPDPAGVQLETQSERSLVTSPLLPSNPIYSAGVETEVWRVRHG